MFNFSKDLTPNEQIATYQTQINELRRVLPYVAENTKPKVIAEESLWQSKIDQLENVQKDIDRR